MKSGCALCDTSVKVDFKGKRGETLQVMPKILAFNCTSFVNLDILTSA